MLITSYNPDACGDVIIAILKPDIKEQSVERNGNIVRIFNEVNNETIGFNFFNVSNIIHDLNDLKHYGNIILSALQLDQLNDLLIKNDFHDVLTYDDDSKFVVGYVEEVIPHPHSDHLHITHTRINNNQVLQIVCGASNIRVGQKVVVAKNGAMMPNGNIIWNGKLLDIESDGMICSARELNLANNIYNKHGILVLPDNKYDVGDKFNIE